MKLCKDCRYFRFSTVYPYTACLNENTNRGEVNPITGGPATLDATVARRPGEYCGPPGHLFEPKPAPAPRKRSAFLRFGVRR